MEKPKQIKSHWYYIFWAACAVAVVGGQIYVGNGYRQMARSQERMTAVMINSFDRVMPRFKVAPSCDENLTNASHYATINR